MRELENVIERAVILSNGPALEVPRELLPAASPPQAVVDARPATTGVGESTMPADRLRQEEVERHHIVSILKQTKWRIDGPQGAARLLDMNPSTLRSRIKQLGVRRGDGPS